MSNLKGVTLFYNVPRIGDLVLDTSLWEYDNVPMVFTCKDKDDNIYFLICDDFISEYSWLTTPISKETLDQVISREITIMTPFKITEGEVLIINKKFGSSEPDFEWCKFSDIPKEELPHKDQYL